MTRDSTIRMRYGEIVMVLVLFAAAGPAHAEEAAESPDELYLRALDAWRSGQARTALMLAQRAVTAAGGTHPHAQLLLAYAHQRAGSRETALEQFALLEANPDAPAEVRAAARRTLARHRERGDRTAPSVSFGSQVAGRWTGEFFVPGLGYSFGVDWPVLGLFGPAVEVSAYDTSDGDPLIEGPVVDILGSMHVPLSDGSWALQIKAGPSVWVASGALYGSDIVPQVGTRAILGADVRAWPAAGLSFAAGAWAWPGLAQSLPSWMFGWDFRTSITLWFPRPGR